MKTLGAINRGGFGRVERVRLDDGSDAARKVFEPASRFLDEAGISKLKKRFSREVRVQSSLSGDYFVPVIDFDLDAQEPWYMMPLADRNFSEQIREDRQAGKINSVALADILSALEELHSLGFVHRDLKPENILLFGDRWKLSDFGLVLPPEGATTKLTSTDSAWGTQLYAAPEQMREFARVGPAADIYSFGCILHDIYGDGDRIPFQRHTCADQVGVIVEKCTELDPSKRFKSVTAVRGFLFTLLAAPSAASDPKDKEWAEELDHSAGWDRKKLEELARFIHVSESRVDCSSIYRKLDEEMLVQLHELEPDLWEEIALGYCHWARGPFLFEYCDVVANRLWTIFSIGSIDCKSEAALAAAELGSTHNRWVVMRRLFRMCDKQLDTSAARRIAIEIVVQDAHQHFIDCAEHDRVIDDLHPIIAEVLKGAGEEDSR